MDTPRPPPSRPEASHNSLLPATPLTWQTFVAISQVTACHLLVPPANWWTLWPTVQNVSTAHISALTTRTDSSTEPQQLCCCRNSPGFCSISAQHVSTLLNCCEVGHAAQQHLLVRAACATQLQQLQQPCCLSPVHASAAYRAGCCDTAAARPTRPPSSSARWCAAGASGTVSVVSVVLLGACIQMATCCIMCIGEWCEARVRPGRSGAAASSRRGAAAGGAAGGAACRRRGCLR